MAIKSMDLAWISTSDFARSKKFFVDVLGLKVSSMTEEYEWMELTGSHGGAILGVGKCTKDSPVQAGKNAVMTMSVDDLIKTKADLEAKGVTFVGDILVVPGHVKMAFFTDPDGNFFQLVQLLIDKP